MAVKVKAGLAMSMRREYLRSLRKSPMNFAAWFEVMFSAGNKEPLFTRTYAGGALNIGLNCI
jgi:hypothetical protein